MNAPDCPTGPTIGPELLTEYGAASRREWLVTNGAGAYAMGTLAGANTRRYHGILVAALTPPTGRRVVLSKLEEAAIAMGERFDLSANQYPGAIHPTGFRHLNRFTPYPAPTWLYRIGDSIRIQKTVWMERARNTIFVRYLIRSAPAALQLQLTPLVAWKDYHHEMHRWDGFPLDLVLDGPEARLALDEQGHVLTIRASRGHTEYAGYWHESIEHQAERERGLDWHEDLYCPAHFVSAVEEGDEVTFIASLEPEVGDADASLKAIRTRQAGLCAAIPPQDELGRTLALASDAFVVEPAPRVARATIIAGYPWFSDWGRDTMISLRGLCLATGRFDVARQILTAYAEFVDQGMLPNRFPDVGQTPEYNTVDATLWYFRAIDSYRQAAPDGDDLARSLWPILRDIVDWHCRGTRYGIHVDPGDGLLHSGEPGLQLTWMDARVGDWVVTPRMGKAVEINALWYAALRTASQVARLAGDDPSRYDRLAEQARAGFQAFVREDGQGLYDVLTESGPDPAIRCNQILAVSETPELLSREQARSVVDTVERLLLTPVGLRTLSPTDPAYRPRYEGGPAERDAAYHQGTVWPWLLGPFAEAHLRAYGDVERARSCLRPIANLLTDACIGSIAEVYDGDPPQRPNGCPAQAWSVAETLRVWRLLHTDTSPGRPDPATGATR